MEGLWSMSDRSGWTTAVLQPRVRGCEGASAAPWREGDAKDFAEARPACLKIRPAPASTCFELTPRTGARSGPGDRGSMTPLDPSLGPKMA
mmetsp:Transcript_78374/g.181835  ORF Transcript_78374/g.181835 Transcript_78374/m.181835 type:complete len:91 (+) Transcript_78374:291-563(+)